jgi:hypothetical protein
MGTGLTMAPSEHDMARFRMEQSTGGLPLGRRVRALAPPHIDGPVTIHQVGADPVALKPVYGFPVLVPAESVTVLGKRRGHERIPELDPKELVKGPPRKRSHV